jgi:hypothetical protein
MVSDVLRGILISISCQKIDHPPDSVRHQNTNNLNLNVKLDRWGSGVAIAWLSDRNMAQACPPSLSLRRGGRGSRPEFQGGGLIRSAGGNKAGLPGRSKEESEESDARILGSAQYPH